jgi:hypothetical protein
MWRGTCRDGTAWLNIDALVRVIAVIAGCGLPVGGCTTAGSPIIGVGGVGSTTVAFESIDGPPESVFRKLVVQLTQEANARQLAVVSRESPALYRIRAYVAAHIQGKKTTIAWVWDVYNGERQRTMRLSGEVPGAAAERAWAAADDQVVGRMASDGMERLAAYLASPGPAPGDLPPVPTQDTAPGVAFAPAADGTLAYAPSSGP